MVAKLVGGDLVNTSPFHDNNHLTKNNCKLSLKGEEGRGKTTQKASNVVVVVLCLKTEPLLWISNLSAT